MKNRHEAAEVPALFEPLEERCMLDGFPGPDLVGVMNDQVMPTTVVPGETGVIRVNITTVRSLVEQ